MLQACDIDMNRICLKPNKERHISVSPSWWDDSRDISKSTFVLLKISLLFSVESVSCVFVPVWSCKFHDVCNIVNKLSSPSESGVFTFSYFFIPQGTCFSH